MFIGLDLPVFSELGTAVVLPCLLVAVFTGWIYTAALSSFKAVLPHFNLQSNTGSM